jgi:hypothetical protein
MAGLIPTLVGVKWVISHTDPKGPPGTSPSWLCTGVGLEAQGEAHLPYVVCHNYPHHGSSRVTRHAVVPATQYPCVVIPTQILFVGHDDQKQITHSLTHSQTQFGCHYLC